MPLRPSQVETLRAVREITARPRTFRAGARWVSQLLGISEQAAYQRMQRLEDHGYLASSYSNRRIAFYLTQLGREALEGRN